jgi:acyl-CoA thioester hydrolase
MIILDPFNFEAPIQIRWADLDPLNHVNNAIYFSYFEIARGPYMLTAAPTWDWYKDMFIIASISADFKKELKIDALNPRVKVRTSKIGSKSFELEYAVISTNPKDGAPILHALGKSTQVLFDTSTRSTILIPDWLKDELSTFDAIIL